MAESICYFPSWGSGEWEETKDAKINALNHMNKTFRPAMSYVDVATLISGVPCDIKVAGMLSTSEVCLVMDVKYCSNWNARGSFLNQVKILKKSPLKNRKLLLAF